MNIEYIYQVIAKYFQFKTECTFEYEIFQIHQKKYPSKSRSNRSNAATN